MSGNQSVSVSASPPPWHQIEPASPHRGASVIPDKPPSSSHGKGKKLIKRDNTINPKAMQNAAKALEVVVKNAMVEDDEKEKVDHLTYSVLQKTVALCNVESAGESGEKQRHPCISSGGEGAKACS